MKFTISHDQKCITTGLFVVFSVLNLWDCGGQESFMEQYFASQKDNIFRNVEVLIYVFDVESRELDNDMHYYQSCLEAIYKVIFVFFRIYTICSILSLTITRILRTQRSFVWFTKWIWWPRSSAM